MKTIKLNATIQVPQNATEAQITEWVRYHLGCANGISDDSPLFDEDNLLAETIDIDFGNQQPLSTEVELIASATELDGEVNLSNPSDIATMSIIASARSLIQYSTEQYSIVIPDNVESLWTGTECGQWIPAMVYLPNESIK